MPVHLFKRNRPKERLSTVRKFDYADLTDSSLYRHFRDTKYAIVVLACVGGVDVHLT
jgi:hypothetical protein